MHVICLAVADQLIWRCASEAGQRLGTKPSIGSQRRPGFCLHARKDFQHLAEANLGLAGRYPRSAHEGISSQAQRVGYFGLGCAQRLGNLRRGKHLIFKEFLESHAETT